MASVFPCVPLRNGSGAPSASVGSPLANIGPCAVYAVASADRVNRIGRAARTGLVFTVRGQRHAARMGGHSHRADHSGKQRYSRMEPRGPAKGVALACSANGAVPCCCGMGSGRRVPKLSSLKLWLLASIRRHLVSDVQTDEMRSGRGLARCSVGLA